MKNTRPVAPLLHLERIELGVTLVLHCRLPADAAFSFQPGQYTQLLLPQGGAITLSIASSPQRLPRLRFLYRHTPGDESAERFLQALRSGDPLRLAPAAGQVCWDCSSPQPSVLIGAGTGIAQSLSILETVDASHRERFGSYTALWLAAQETEQLCRTRDEAWLSQGAALHRFNDHKLGPDNAGLRWLRRAARSFVENNARILLGGTPGFVYVVHDLLLDCGVRREQLHADSYEYAPRTEQP